MHHIYNTTFKSLMASSLWDGTTLCHVKFFLRRWHKCRTCDLITVYLNQRGVTMNHRGTVSRTDARHLAFWSPAFFGHTWITVLMPLYLSYLWKYLCLTRLNLLKAEINDVLAIRPLISSINAWYTAASKWIKIWMIQYLTEFLYFHMIYYNEDFPGSSDSKESVCNARDLSLVPGSGRSPGKGNGNPLYYSGLEIPMGRGAWWATVHRVTKSQTWLSVRHTITGKERFIISVKAEK